MISWNSSFIHTYQEYVACLDVRMYDFCDQDESVMDELLPADAVAALSYASQIPGSFYDQHLVWGRLPCQLYADLAKDRNETV